jgi:hypothetical protein
MKFLLITSRGGSTHWSGCSYEHPDFLQNAQKGFKKCGKKNFIDIEHSQIKELNTLT